MLPAARVSYFGEEIRDYFSGITGNVELPEMTMSSGDSETLDWVSRGFGIVTEALEEKTQVIHSNDWEAPPEDS